MNYGDNVAMRAVRIDKSEVACHAMVIMAVEERTGSRMRTDSQVPKMKR